MPNQLSGTIIAFGERRTFQKKDGSQGWNQEVILDSSRFNQQTGEKYENYPSVDISDRNQLPQLAVGMRVRFDIDVQGRYYQDKQTGQQRHITVVSGYKCEILAQPQQQPYLAAPPQQSYPQAPQQAFPPQQNNSPFPPTNAPF